MSQLPRIPGIMPIGSPGQYAPKPQGITPIGAPGQYAPKAKAPPGPGIGIAPGEPEPPKPQALPASASQELPSPIQWMMGSTGTQPSKPPSGIGVQQPTAAPAKPAQPQAPVNKFENPAPAPGAGFITDAAKYLGNAGMSFAANTVNGAMHPPGRSGSVVNPPAPALAPTPGIGLPPVEAPLVPAPAAAQVGAKNEGHPGSPVQAPTADQLNASYDAAGYGPHSTEPQVDQARTAHAEAGGIGVQTQAPQSKAGRTYQDQMRATLARQFQDNAWHAEHNGSQLVAHEDGGYHWDHSNHNNYVANQMHAAGMIDKINATEGDIRNRDPNTEVQAQIAGLSTPQGRALAEGRAQMVPGSIPAPGTPADNYNATNVGPGDRVDANVQGLHNILHGDMPLHQKVAAASAIPGIGTPGSAHQKLFDAWMARQQATGEGFQSQVNQYGNTGASANNGLTDHAWGGTFYDPNSRPMGATQARNQQFHANMAKLGYKFHPQ